MKNSKLLSIILFIVSIAIAPIVFYFICTIGQIDIFGPPTMKYLWIMFPFASLPAISTIFGIIMTTKKQKTKKNIIAGSIAFSFMIIMGIYSFAFESNQSGSFLVETSKITGITMPTEVKSKSYHSDDGRIGNAILLNDNEKQAFELEIQTERWVDELTPASKGVLPFSIAAQSIKYDCFCFYMSPEGVFNPTTISSGEYKMVYLAYEKSKAHLFIYDFDLKVA